MEILQKSFRPSYQQKLILAKLFYWNCKIDKFKEYYSDKQSLYLALRKLIKFGYIEKVNSEYRITPKGKEIVNKYRLTPLL